MGGHRGDSTMRARAVAYRSINQGLALSALSECSSLFVPIHAESLHYAAEGKSNTKSEGVPGSEHRVYGKHCRFSISISPPSFKLVSLSLSHLF